MNNIANNFIGSLGEVGFLSSQGRQRLARRIGVGKVTGSIGTGTYLGQSNPWRIRYNGAASYRTRYYANKGNAAGIGAAVQNRADALRERYGNDPRITRAASNIMAQANVYK